MLSGLLKACRRNEGAAAIESLATMVLFIFALVVAFFIGITYYNLSVLSSSAQNITLNTQVQIDRYCSPQQNPTNNECDKGLTGAFKLNEIVRRQTRVSLAGMDSTGRVLTCTVNPGVIYEAPCDSQSGVTSSLGYTRPNTAANVVIWPAVAPVNGATFSALPAGWGYNAVTLRAEQSLFGSGVNSLLPGLGGGLAVSGRSISISYKDPSSSL